MLTAATRDEAADSTDVSPAAREAARAALLDRLPLLRHQLAMAEADADGPDPESAAMSLRALRRSASLLLARLENILPS